ncbi:PspC domain-containing protein [Planotetraspora kaengkrachanensis]|nr:PspC domain-containing protein [Planotetraspora kaengkrachanensis]
MNEMNTNGSVKQLRRTRNGKVIAGVCSGVGEYIGVDPNILRVVLAVASFFGGLGVGVYAVAWILVPEEGREGSIAQDLINKNKDTRVWQDAKVKWDQGWSQAGWNRPAPQQPQSPYQPTTGYEQHPYGRPDAPTSAPAPAPASAPAPTAAPAPASAPAPTAAPAQPPAPAPAPAADAAPAAARPATATEAEPAAPASEDPPAPKPEDPAQA